KGKDMQLPQQQAPTKFTPLAISLFFSLLFLLSQSHSIVVAQNESFAAQADIRKLEVGTPIVREMKGGEWHSYEITLAAGQYLNAVVEQKGVDVVVVVIAPNGKALTAVDSPNGTVGPEPVALVAKSAGVYRLIVKSLEKDAPVGKYEIRIKELRPATEKDRA